jgi:hypothetical protein
MNPVRLTFTCHPVSDVTSTLHIGRLSVMSSSQLAGAMTISNATITLSSATVTVDHPHASADSHCLLAEITGVEFNRNAVGGFRSDGEGALFGIGSISSIALSASLPHADEILVAHHVWLGGVEVEDAESAGGADGFGAAPTPQSARPTSGTFFVHLNLRDLRVNLDLGHDVGRVAASSHLVSLHATDSGRVRGKAKHAPLSIELITQKITVASQGRLGIALALGGLALSLTRDYDTADTRALGGLPLNRWWLVIPSIVGRLDYRGYPMVNVRTGEAVVRFRDWWARDVDPGPRPTPMQQGLITVDAMDLELCAETVPSLVKVSHNLSMLAADRSARARTVVGSSVYAKNIYRRERGGGLGGTSARNRSSRALAGVHSAAPAAAAAGAPHHPSSAAGGAPALPERAPALIPIGEVAISIFPLNVGLLGASLNDNHWLNLYFEEFNAALSQSIVEGGGGLGEIEVQRFQRVRLRDVLIEKMDEAPGSTAGSSGCLSDRVVNARPNLIAQIPDANLTMVSSQPEAPYGRNVYYEFDSAFDEPLQVTLRGDMYQYMQRTVSLYTSEIASVMAKFNRNSDVITASAPSGGGGAGSAAAAARSRTGAMASQPASALGPLVFHRELLDLRPQVHVGDLTVSVGEVLARFGVSVDAVPETLFAALTLPLESVIGATSSLSEAIHGISPD